MKVSVVILNWNGKALMEDLLDNVVDNTINDNDGLVELVVADNGSSDGSLDFLRKKYADKIRIIDLKHNHGFAEGYNLALTQINSEYVVLLNSDVEVTNGWLKTLTDFMDANPEVAACQPKIKSLRNRNSFEHAGAAGGYMDFLGYPFCRGRVLSWIEEDKGQYDDQKDLFWATGACLLIRLQDFRDAGELDARFFAHMEEIDLCWRLRSRGKRIVCVPKSCVYHLGGATLNKENPQKTYLNYRNNLLMLYKNYNSNFFAFVFVLRLILDYMSLLVFLISGKFGDASAVIKARKSFWIMRPHFKAQRVENKASAILTDIPQIYKGSLILECYLLGKRKFSDFYKY
jgi:GT2 family glycosyltransferase